MFLESSCTALRHFALLKASSFFSPNCSRYHTCLLHIIFGHPSPLLPKSNPLLNKQQYFSSKHVHTIAFHLLQPVCIKFMENIRFYDLTPSYFTMTSRFLDIIRSPRLRYNCSRTFIVHWAALIFVLLTLGYAVA